MAPSSDSGGFCKDPSATMRILSIVSGILLFVVGFFGMFNIFSPLTAMISLYGMVFGLVIVCSECKDVPIISVLYRQLEYYVHFLVYPRGKAIFYVFVGLLTFAAWPGWGFTSIASLIVAFVGLIHFITSFFYKAPADESHFAPGMNNAADRQAPPDFRADATQEAFTFARNHPETAKKGASAVFKSGARR
mmetsp:Transcript_15396/g.51956  ORF Transcript_15396/g.51956 Transcript_15396/m.51956 type:complete len:191 (-) Transcript_15396:692-1264(-)